MCNYSSLRHSSADSCLICNKTKKTNRFSFCLVNLCAFLGLRFIYFSLPFHPEHNKATTTQIRNSRTKSSRRVVVDSVQKDSSYGERNIFNVRDDSWFQLHRVGRLAAYRWQARGARNSPISKEALTHHKKRTNRYN